jgi:hypothetical protein
VLITRAVPSAIPIPSWFLSYSPLEFWKEGAEGVIVFGEGLSFVIAEWYYYILIDYTEYG